MYYIMSYRCYLKLGSWQEELQGLTELSIPDVLEYYGAATFHDPSWYKAWHSWAYMNFETVLFYKHQQNKLQSNEQTGEKGISVKANSEVIKLICSNLIFNIIIYIYICLGCKVVQPIHFTVYCTCC